MSLKPQSRRFGSVVIKVLSPLQPAKLTCRTVLLVLFFFFFKLLNEFYYIYRCTTITTTKFYSTSYSFSYTPFCSIQCFWEEPWHTRTKNWFSACSRLVIETKPTLLIKSSLVYCISHEGFKNSNTQIQRQSDWGHFQQKHRGTLLNRIKIYK